MKTRTLETNAQTSGSPKPTHEQIAAMAYHLYVESGRQDGCSTQNWLRAEELLTEQMRHRKTGADSPLPQAAPTSQLLGPLDAREYPFARDDRGSASREEIRRQTTQLRPAARQSQRQPERSRQPR